jgi:hypothetical protein
MKRSDLAYVREDGYVLELTWRTYSISLQQWRRDFP